MWILASPPPPSLPTCALRLFHGQGGPPGEGEGEGVGGGGLTSCSHQDVINLAEFWGGEGSESGGRVGGDAWMDGWKQQERAKKWLKKDLGKKKKNEVSVLTLARHARSSVGGGGGRG